MSEKKTELTDFEKNLKLKMDELASSVDCFEKISQRAFPEVASEYDEFEDSVSELEHDSGRHMPIRMASFIAAAAAVALCLFFLAKPGSFLNNALSNIGSKSEKQLYREIIAEIKSETAANSYDTYDLALDEFISNDVLISPLYGCPFEENKHGSSIRVRVFVRTCGGIQTNQIYAVEYDGDYEDENFIAAADSKVKFDSDEIGEIDFKKYLFDFANGELPYDRTLAADFTYTSLYKSGDEIIPLSSEVIYSHENGSDDYTYDIRVYDNKYMRMLDINEILSFENEWNNVVYYNGTSAAADEELSDFVYDELKENNTEISGIEIISPISCTEFTFSEEVSERIGAVLKFHGNSESEIKIPAAFDSSNTDSFLIFYTDDPEITIIEYENSSLGLSYRCSAYEDSVSLEEKNKEQQQVEIENDYQISLESERELIKIQITQLESRTEVLTDEEKEMLDELEKKLKLLNEQIEQIQSDIAEN
ncbi:MAG: hypothetical protein PUA81_03040 [Oscillospiraceae bacterium]|nr:hypothetical protein [Oscillospiraceae bacterium]